RTRFCERRVEALNRYADVTVKRITPLFQSSFIELNQIEIRPNIFTSVAAGFSEKMQKTRLFCGRIGMARNHTLVPLFDGFGRMLLSIFLQPSETCVVLIPLVGNFFERPSVDFEQRE